MPNDTKKKDKKEDMDKLRMILDSPFDAKSVSSNDALLDSVRKRLVGEPSQQDIKFRESLSDLTKKSDSLTPQVKIHQPEKEIKRVETEKLQTPAKIERRFDIEEIIDPKDLYEIEKVEIPNSKPSEIKQQIHVVAEKENLPEWIPVDTLEKVKSEEKLIDEWIPVDTSEKKETKETKDEPVSEWSSVTPLKKNKASLSEPKPQPEFAPIATEPEPRLEPAHISEISKPKIPLIEQDKKTDVFHEIKSIDAKTAEILYEHGYTSLEKIQNVTVKDVVATGVEKRVAKAIRKELNKTQKKQEKETKKQARQPKKTVIEQTKPAEDVEEWESYRHEQTEEPIKEEPTGFTYEEYTLYKKEIETSDGKKRTIHFFSKTPPEAAEAVSLPDGFEVKLNDKTGLPFLKKKT